MDKKSKYLIGSFILIFAVSVFWDYRVFFITHDFIIKNTTVCDPQINSCFVSCDAGECGTDYYAKITKRASNIPICNVGAEKCASLICYPSEQGCEITYCSESTVQDNESCTNTKDFQIEKSASISSSTEPTI